VANGDISTPQKALEVLAATGADALMIGRAAQGRPWIFAEIAHFLETGELLPAPRIADAKRWLIEHLHDHYTLYGELTGMRSARKHIGWAVRALPGGEAFRRHMNTLDSCEDQVRSLGDWLDALAQDHDRLPYLAPAANDDPDEEFSSGVSLHNNDNSAHEERRLTA
jgi:tRNA-dihydrouridine synthase B